MSDGRGPEAIARLLGGSWLPPAIDEAALGVAIRGSLDAIFDAAARARWAARLREVASLFGRLGDPRQRNLAATAATARSPESGVPLLDQPLPALIRHQSAYRDAMDVDDAMFDLAREVLTAASVQEPAPPQRRRKTADADGLATVFQLKIVLKGTKPPIWRRVLVDST